MRKLWLIIRREYRLRVHTRTFILSTVGLPALMIAGFVLPTYLASRRAERTLRIAVVDQAGGLAQMTAKRLEAHKLPNGKPQFEVVSAIETRGDSGRATERLRAEVRAGKLDGYLLLTPQVLKSGTAEFHTRDASEFALTALTTSLENAITKVAVAGRLAEEKVHVNDLDDLLARVNVDVVQVKKQGEAVERGATFEAAIFLAAILYVSLLLYGVTTMRSIQEEKSTRIMEILLSSVRPFPLLAGKILGVAAVGFTQYLIWALAGAAMLGYGAESMSMLGGGVGSSALHFPLALWIWFVIYFLGGYLLYSSLFAAVGAAVSSEQEMNQAQLPITMLLVASFFMFPLVARNPSSHAAVLLTMIPFFSPVLMMMRIALETPPLWQILTSVAILAVTTVAMVYLSAKIYRVGVLMYGKRPSAVEILRWLRYT